MSRNSRAKNRRRRQARKDAKSIEGVHRTGMGLSVKDLVIVARVSKLPVFQEAHLRQVFADFVEMNPAFAGKVAPDGRSILFGGAQPLISYIKLPKGKEINRHSDADLNQYAPNIGPSLFGIYFVVVTPRVGEPYMDCIVSSKHILSSHRPFEAALTKLMQYAQGQIEKVNLRLDANILKVIPINRKVQSPFKASYSKIFTGLAKVIRTKFRGHAGTNRPLSLVFSNNDLALAVERMNAGSDVDVKKNAFLVAVQAYMLFQATQKTVPIRRVVSVGKQKIVGNALGFVDLELLPTDFEGTDVQTVITHLSRKIQIATKDFSQREGVLQNQRLYNATDAELLTYQMEEAGKTSEGISNSDWCCSPGFPFEFYGGGGMRVGSLYFPTPARGVTQTVKHNQKERSVYSAIASNQVLPQLRGLHKVCVAFSLKKTEVWDRAVVKPLYKESLVQKAGFRSIRNDMLLRPINLACASIVACGLYAAAYWLSQSPLVESVIAPIAEQASTAVMSLVNRAATAFGAEMPFTV